MQELKVKVAYRRESSEKVKQTFGFSILASGSSGNCTYIESGQTSYLVDAGLSGKKIHELFHQINRDPSQLSGIFVTHEHKDHIHGVGVLSRKYQIPIYANRATWAAMAHLIGAIAPENRRMIEPDQLLTLPNLDVMAYEVSHDAAHPQFYAFQKENHQFVMLTDTGYVSDKLRQTLKNADAYLIESNHEIEMLRNGNYPWSLKQRILGDKGHLCNEDGALAMVDMIGESTSSIYLGHLSRDNNTKEKAMTAMKSILNRYDYEVGRELKLYMTDPAQAQPIEYLV